MFSFISTIWNNLVDTGTHAIDTEREKRDVRLFNRTWLTVIIIQVICLISHLANSLHSATYTTIWFIAALCSLYYMVKKGHVNFAKMAAIIFISIDTSVNAMVFGEQTFILPAIKVVIDDTVIGKILWQQAPLTPRYYQIKYTIYNFPQIKLPTSF
jgi:hypothetical protein